MAKWLDIDEEARRNETMPAIFEENSNVDGLCDSGRSIPWSHIRRTALEKIERLRETLPSRPQQFVARHRHREEIYKHVSETTRDTADTAVAGCHLCALVLFVLFSRAHEVHPMQKYYDQLGDRSPFHTLNTNRTSLASWNGRKRMELIFDVGRSDLTNPIGLTIRVKVPRRSIADHADLTVAIDHTQTPGPSKADRESPSTTSICKYWLDVCTRGHHKCTEGERHAPTLPKRVIRVSQENGFVSARLYIAAGQMSRYAALSHRWSSSSSAQLTSRNIQEFEQRINISELSRTFREAFSLILEVGLEYIWIDSLCIIQDSREDWAQQSACMSTIYSQAYLSICAFTADNGAGFCSTTFKSNLIDTPCQVVQGMYAYPGSPRHLSIPEGTAQSRAWVMQEEMLSRRKLYCGEKGALWVCKSMHSTTTMPCATAIPRDMAFQTPFVNPFEPFIASSSSASEEWKLLISAYTKRSLSYQSDKLPALSAVAKRFGQGAAFNESDYLAGNWRQHLPDSLLWMHERTSFAMVEVLEGPIPSSHESAPSWSWASQQGPIDFFRRGSQHCGDVAIDVSDVLSYPGLNSNSKLLHATTVLKTSNPFGEVSKGILRLQGMTLRNPYPAFQKIKDEVNSQSRISVKADKRKPLEAILMQIERHAGIILEKIHNSDHQRIIYKRIGICVSSTDLLRLIFKDGDWEEAVVEIV